MSFFKKEQIMKKNILIIIAIALVCFGCGREKRGQLTQRGKEIHDSWHTTTFLLIEADVIPVFHLDAWINADNDSVRNQIEDLYFPYQRIRQEEATVYSIYSGSEKQITINTFGQSLNDEGSHWLITREQYIGNASLPQFFDYESDGEILHVGKDGEQWYIQMDGDECYGSSCFMHIKPLENDGNVLFAKGKYTLSGNGSYQYKYGPVLQYNIEKDILREKSDNHSYCSEGIVQLIASQEGYDDINVKAEYLGEMQVCITYRGVTETWK